MKYLLLIVLVAVNLALWVYAAIQNCPHEKLGIGACASFFTFFSAIFVGVLQ